MARPGAIARGPPEKASNAVSSPRPETGPLQAVAAATGRREQAPNGVRF